MLRALQESGQFTVLTANVAGLPGLISSSKPADNTPELGKRLSDFDIVNVQEDFNYHALLYANDNHPHRTPTSGGVPFGSGLNTLSSFPFTTVGAFDRTKWKKCNNNEGSDCMTPKGFTYVQVALADGVLLDVYNLHTDAGTKEGDLVARKSNLDQLAEYILANSKDQAVVVFGDTNTRYTRTGDTIRDFGTRTDLVDAWVADARNGTAPEAGADALVCDLEKTTNDCEVVDKIFFRGNNLLQLELDNFNTESAKFVGPTGKQLSDHVPLSATFSWTLSEALRQSAAVGGPQGTPFTDVNVVPTDVAPTSVTIRGSSRVDAVTVVIGDETLSHGGSGGEEATLTLNETEFISSAEIHTGKVGGKTRVFYVKLTTSTDRTVENGEPTANKVTYTAPDGFQIASFHGRASEGVDALGVVYTRV